MAKGCEAAPHVRESYRDCYTRAMEALGTCQCAKGTLGCSSWPVPAPPAAAVRDPVGDGTWDCCGLWAYDCAGLLYYYTPTQCRDQSSVMIRNYAFCYLFCDTRSYFIRDTLCASTSTERESQESLSQDPGPRAGGEHTKTENQKIKNKYEVKKSAVT